MSSPKPPTSPEDPDWVNAIVERAVQRSTEPTTSDPADSTDQTGLPPNVSASSDAGGPTDRPGVPPTMPPVPAAPHVPPASPPPLEAPPTPPLQQPPVAPATNPDVVSAPMPTPAPSAGHDLFAWDAEPGLPQQDAPGGGPGSPSDIVSAPTAGVWDDVDLSADVEGEDALWDAAVRPSEQEPLDDDEPSVGQRVRSILEWGAVIVGALAVALLIKTFLMQAYYIPSGSMEPTLNINDRVLVNKLSYKFGDIGRGDLVVFHRPPDQLQGEDDLIKRVIGLPGETIEIHEGKIYILPVGETELRGLVEPYLPDGVTTGTFVDTENCVTATANSCVIPDDSIFVMGDNRPGSKDSRYFGPISTDLVVGRAFLRVWPLSDIGFL